MAVMHVNPTRMELTRLKKRLTTAVRGHKLLKVKRDELMRQFLELVRENRRLREQVEDEVRAVHRQFVRAGAVMDKEALDAALLSSRQELELQVGSRNVMSVELPEFTSRARSDSTADQYPYGFAFTSFELDGAVEALAGVLPRMLQLAETEKAAGLLAAEIEKTRRRVNALEHVMIPQLEETIRFIAMKLEENERSSRTRLMKVKDMMLEKAHHYAQ